MKHRLGFFALSLPLLFACGGSEPAPPAAPLSPSARPTASVAPSVATGLMPSAAKQLDADTPMKTASGASFEAPKAWFVATRGSTILLEDPEHDLSVTLVEVLGEADANKAIATAWQQVKPAFALKVKSTVNPPAKDGWDSVTQLAYEVGAEQRTVMAIAQKKGNTQYVALVDGANAGIDRRGAQLMTIFSTFKAPGIEEESFKGKTARPLDAPALAKLEAFIVASLAKTQIPGAAIGIVSGGKLVYEKGFGTRELGKDKPVTPNTLFMIGSTTKSLTTLMMAKLVDEGKFTWDTPMVDVLPSFALGDAAVTKKVLMRHSVCACAGLPRQDLEFFFEYAKATPEQRVESMKQMLPTTGFGETFQYSNTMVATGGYVAAHAAEAQKKLGPAYDAVMQSRVFGPLGMKNSTLDFAVAKSREHAVPHTQDFALTYGAIPVFNEEGVVSVRPAGAAWSSVRDMSRYLLLELSGGKNEAGVQVVSELNLKKRREPQVKITDKLSYGLGLFMEADHGVQIVQHGGNNLGFTSDMYVLPEAGVGVVLLMNGGGTTNALRKAVRRQLMEILFDGKPQAAEGLEFRLKHEREGAEKALATIQTQPDAAWMKQWVGKYENASLGALEVKFDGKEGTVDVGEWKSTFGKQTGADGSVHLILLGRPWLGFEFVPAVSNGALTLTRQHGQQKYVFTTSSTVSVAKKPAAP
jgi:CubicO group peptidase (beta-lactamase class C family)